MAASARLCSVLRITIGGAASLRTVGSAVQMSHLASRAAAASLQRQPSFPPVPLTSWQQSRCSSFFNKLTAENLWKGVLAESGALRKGRGKRSKRILKKDLNRGQNIGEGRGGFLWPGLNVPVVKEGAMQNMSRRSVPNQQEVQAALFRQRDEWVKKKKMKKITERGWSGSSWGGLSFGSPDPGPNGESNEDFDSRLIALRSAFPMSSKAGRQRSISCLVAVGNGKGSAGFAMGKAVDRRVAVRKAKNQAIHYLYYIDRYNDHTVFHDFESTFKKTTVRVKKKHKGYGLCCHRAIITLCKLIGIKDLYCKVEGSINILNMTRAFFAGLTSQETFQMLADRKQLHVVEYNSEQGPLPIVVASPKHGARTNPEPLDHIPDTKLHWDDVQAAQGTKTSLWSGVKRNIL